MRGRLPNQAPSTARFRFYGDLATLLKSRYRQDPALYRFRDAPGVKDPIEAMGVPHTEVGAILANGSPVGFRYPLQDGDLIEVYPPKHAVPTASIDSLSPPLPDPVHFILDVHLGTLARRLRLLGFDALYRNDFSDEEIILLALAQGRIILTRDRGLLKQRRVDHGRLIRSDLVDHQVDEVLSRYGLHDQIRPWALCMACNGVIEPVEKSSIAHRLEPKTRLYYERFQRCRSCDRLYWQGSHYEQIARWVETLRSGTKIHT